MIEIHEEFNCDIKDCNAMARTKTYHALPSNIMKLPTLPLGWVAVTRDRYYTQVACPECAERYQWNISL